MAKRSNDRAALALMSERLATRNRVETEGFSALIASYQQIMSQLQYMSTQNQRMHFQVSNPEPKSKQDDPDERRTVDATTTAYLLHGSNGERDGKGNAWTPVLPCFDLAVT